MRYFNVFTSELLFTKIAFFSFPFDWSTIDEENGAIIFQVQNAFPKPFKDDGTPFMFPNITRLVYAGNGLLKEEQDWYNPKLHAGKDTLRKYSCR